jgi:cell division protein FtsZ
MDEIGAITDYIQDEAGLTADIIWGNCYDEALEDRISVTLIATGFKTRDEQGKEAKENKVVTAVLSTNTKGETPVAEVKKTVQPIINEEPQPSLEPVLIRDQQKTVKPLEESSFSNEISFEFEVGGTDDDFNSPQHFDEVDPELKIQKTVFPLSNQKVDDVQEEEERRARERVMRLKSMNYRINGSNINDLEKVPAYIRKDIKMQNVPHSSEDHLSESSVSGEENKKPLIKTDTNSFLHNRPD